MSNVFVLPTKRPEMINTESLSVHDIAESLGSTFQDVKAAVERELHNLSDFSVKVITCTVPAGFTTKEVQSYLLDVDAAKFIVARFGNAVGAAYLKALIQTDRKYSTAVENLKDPQMARNFAKALLERADLQDELEVAKAIVDHQTKALTTSQATNGNKTRQVKALTAEVLELKGQLGDAGSYRTVSSMMNYLPENANLSLVGKRLTKLSEATGYETRKVEHMKYPAGVKAYHVAVWQAYLAVLPKSEQTTLVGV